MPKKWKSTSFYWKNSNEGLFMKKLFLIFLFFGLSMQSVFSQFGQNKVQYKVFDWYYIQTKHFDIYFTENSNTITEFTAKAAEEALTNIENELNYKLNNRLSLVVYNSHNDFQETNTTDSYLSRGIGGFTEPFKNRIVFPFEGNYKKFRHVIHHELVHGVMRDMLYGGTVQNIVSKGITLDLPQWYHEGMAEYISSGWETNTDMFIRDAIINDYLPDVEALTGYFGYRGGQAVMKFIAEKYGEGKIGEILSKAKGLNNLNEAVKASLGISLKELNEKWKKELKITFWPDIAKRDDPDVFAKRLTNNKEDGGFYNSSPAISPQGDKIAFISDRDVFFNIYIMDAFDGKIIKEIVETGRTNDFEELNVLTPAITWAPDNKKIAFSIKSGGYDVIYIVDTEDEEKEILPVQLEGISSVSWSPDGKYIAFVGHSQHQSDIYIYNLHQKELLNITNDLYSETDPSWSWDGQNIFYASDNEESFGPDRIIEENVNEIKISETDIFSVNIETRIITRYTDNKYSDESSPVLSPDGKYLFFISDINGISNIYKKEIDLNEGFYDYSSDYTVPITNSLNGLNQLSISKDGKKLVFSSLYNSGYNIFLINNPLNLNIQKEELEPTSYMQQYKLYKEEDAANPNFLSFNFRENIYDYTDSAGEAYADSVHENGNNIFIGNYEEKDTLYSVQTQDYRNYVFGKDIQTNSTDSLENINLFNEKLDRNGNFLVHKYKINFSADLIYANAGYSTFYGLLGTTVMSFSDVLGNHRLIGITSMQIDLKNSDYGIAYQYLPKKIDLGFEAFHTARFVYLSGIRDSELHRFRNVGFVASASYPTSRFYRWDASIGMLNLTSDNLDNPFSKTEKVTYFIPSISFVHDNTLYGYISPIEGTRYNLTLFGNPGLNGKRRSFYSMNWDYRKYFRFLYDNSFVFRISGGYSGGANPQRYFLGGTDNWINRKFATGEIPLSNASDFAFLSPALPMRGYDYAERIGTKYSLMNLELRMPLLRYLFNNPFPLLGQSILNTIFIDAGSAWDNNKKLQFFEKNENGKLITKDLLLGTGVGARLYLLYFLVRFDVAWSFDMNKFSRPKYYFSLGTDF